MKKSDAVGLLAGRGWLSFTPPAFRDSVLSRLRLREYRKRESVYSAGDPTSGLLGIVSGGVEIEVPPPGATSHLVHYASTGFWFGEWSFIVGVRRYGSVAATRPTILSLLPTADCRAILKADPSAWQWFALLSAMTTELSVGFVTDSLLTDPAQRLAALLLRLSGMRSIAFQNREPSRVYLSREKLAHLAGLTRNSVIPVLRNFAERGWIEIGYGSILVMNVRALEKSIS